MKLYEYTMLIDAGFDPETGEILSEEQINALHLEREQKLEAIACFYKDVKAFKESAKAEIERLKNEIERCDKKMDWVERYVSNNMQADEKIKTVRCQISFRKSERVLVDDVDALPQEYKTVKTTYTPNKAEIKDALKAGKEIIGCRIETAENLQIK